MLVTKAERADDRLNGQVLLWLEESDYAGEFRIERESVNTRPERLSWWCLHIIILEGTLSF